MAGEALTHYGPTSPPPGWVGFVARHPEEAAVERLHPQKVRMNPELYAQLDQVNRAVNETTRIRREFGDTWDYPVNGEGDCEDMALEKRRRLIDLGFPRQALLITAVMLDGRGHALLAVRTTNGDLLLDNLTWAIRGVVGSKYVFLKSQSPEHPNLWNALHPQLVEVDLAAAR